MTKGKVSYGKFVRALVKPGRAIKEEITDSEANLWHLVPALAGEAGELMDTVKKHVIYKQPIDRVNVLEELGDIEFYLEAIRQALKIKRSETIEGNVGKLSKRYAKLTYSNSAAQRRADKKG